MKKSGNVANPLLRNIQNIKYIGMKDSIRTSEGTVEIIEFIIGYVKLTCILQPGFSVFPLV